MVKVNIFDMAGLPFFYEVGSEPHPQCLTLLMKVVHLYVHKVRNEFYKNTHGALLVYDVTNRSSFESLGDWLTEMRSHLHDPGEVDSIVFVVCANKVYTACIVIR